MHEEREFAGNTKEINQQNTLKAVEAGQMHQNSENDAIQSAIVVEPEPIVPQVPPEAEYVAPDGVGNWDRGFYRDIAPTALRVAHLQSFKLDKSTV